jgi:hypothetical protein
MHSPEVWEHSLPSITRQNHTRHKTTSLDKLGGICVPQGTSPPHPHLHPPRGKLYFMHKNLTKFSFLKT